MSSQKQSRSAEIRLHRILLLPLFLVSFFLIFTAEKCDAPDTVTCQAFTNRHYTYQNDGPVGEQTTWGDLFMLEEILGCNGICSKGDQCSSKNKIIEVTLPNQLKQKRRIYWCGCAGETTALSPPDECHIIKADKVDDLGAESYVATYCEGNCPDGTCKLTKRYFFRQGINAYTQKMRDDIKDPKTFNASLPELVEVRIVQQCECL